MDLVIMKSVLLRGFSFITLSLGGIDAKAKAAKVSIIRFTHSICVTVNGNSVPTSEPNSTMNSATKLIVNWNTMKRWIFLYNERPPHHGRTDTVERVVQQRDVTCFFRHRCSRSHRQPHLCMVQGRSIIGSVTRHGYHRAFLLQ